MRSLPWLALALLCAALGCAERGPSAGGPAGKDKAKQAPRPRRPADRTTEEPPAEKGAGKDRPDARAGKALPRKIVYTAEVELVVDDLDEASAVLRALVKEYDGYVAKSDVRGTPGAPRSGTWTLRVPAGRFDAFLGEVSRVGERRHGALDSEDITDRYYDLKAEIRNLEAREEALRRLYKEKIAGSKLEDLLAVDREINEVRGRINRAKGQVQRWDKEVEYSTVTVNLRDRKDYVPPIVPDFGSQLGGTFQTSVEALVAAGKFLVLVAVALLPWALVLAVLGAPALVVARRRRRARPTPAAPPTPPAA